MIMVKNAKVIALFMVMLLIMSACSSGKTSVDDITKGNHNSGNSQVTSQTTPDTTTELGGYDDTFGDDITDDLYAGFFDDENVSSGENSSDADTDTSDGKTDTDATDNKGTTGDADLPYEEPTPPAIDMTSIDIVCISGTKDAYTVSGSTVTFTRLSENSVYSISGKLKGNIVIDVGDDYKFDLELHGFSMISDSINPITVLSGNEVAIKAKKGFSSYIYDTREAIDENDESLYSGAVHSEVDLEISGKGSLTVVSENNNGIHTKDDLRVKNLTLTVSCVDNALKGNDSVSIENAMTTLISRSGDGIKTSNSDISEKGNQRGNITVTGGEHTIYAACDGIDAAHNVEINDSSTKISIYTDKYSNYSEQVTVTDSDLYFIRFTSKSLSYSVKYYNSEDDFEWVNAEYHSSASGSRSTYYYYSFPKKTEYQMMQVFLYTSDMTMGQEENYYAQTDYMAPNTAYDTFALTNRGNRLAYDWVSYTTTVNDGMGGGMGPGGMGPGGMGPGGMGEGNKDKGAYSTKGIKADNEIIINDGEINIKSYDDAIHANSDVSLENGNAPLGNIRINGGLITVYSNDDGIHADGALEINGGTVSVINSYEGIEGASVNIAGGSVSVISSDDGINATLTQGTAVSISGGSVYIYSSGDGIDSNSRSSGIGIVFSGGKTVVISTSGGNSAIDTENGYSYMSGYVLAIMSSNGMTNEATHCSNFSSIGINKSASLISSECVTVSAGGADIVTVKMPINLSARVIYLGSSSASVKASSADVSGFDANGVIWH